eukprot:CAMPEP_0119561574 /NCGR_PEP_ID=MMETSP1352-20130426/18006_1 /TAXON_ID=265584 /ORGANISM="Stauroneis constricta, Strain CCMP1120" /LENGTH=685 /DNA_ID=CAMNT_0007609803 /DNA_START=68 /DNA_END=2125 /DNA_ORIENTATION=+
MLFHGSTAFFANLSLVIGAALHRADAQSQDRIINRRQAWIGGAHADKRNRRREEATASAIERKVARPSFFDGKATSPTDDGAHSDAASSSTTQRSLQDIQDTSEVSRAVLDVYCSPNGPKLGICSNCPPDLATFNISTDELILQCEEPCYDAFQINFLGASGAIVGQHTNTRGTEITCSSAQKFVADRCHPLGALNRPNPIAANFVSCDCFDNFNPDVSQAIMKCTYTCVERFISFPGNGTVNMLPENEQRVCDYVATTKCLDNANTSNCDCSEAPTTPTGSGTIACPGFECLQSTYKIENGFQTERYFLPIPDCQIEISLPKNVAEVCDRSGNDFFNCNCANINNETLSGTATCAPDPCETQTYTFENNQLTAYLGTFSYYTSHGELAYQRTMDSYNCPTMNGVPCTCTPVTDCETGIFPHLFEVNCGDGFSISTCNPTSLSASSLCAAEIIEKCDKGDDNCDCGLLERDGGGAIKFPLSGKATCADPFCNTTSTYTFNGDKTFLEEKCRQTPTPGIDEICVTRPSMFDGTSCPISADGVECNNCEPIFCNDYFRVFPNTLSFECPVGDGSIFASRACAQVDSRYCAGPQPSPTTPPPSDGSASAGETAEPTLVPTITVTGVPTTKAPTAMPEATLTGAPTEGTAATQTPTSAPTPASSAMGSATVAVVVSGAFAMTTAVASSL